MADNSKPKRQYHRITPAVIAQHSALEALRGNGTAVVREMTPTVRNAHDRAFHIRRKAAKQSVEQFIDQQLQQIGIDAVNELGSLVFSTDERIKTKNVHYVIDHIRGQATKKSITLHGKANIQSVLD